MFRILGRRGSLFFQKETYTCVSLDVTRVQSIPCTKIRIQAFAMATSNAVSKRPVGRRYIVACDGTWQNSDMANPKGEPSNVTRIARAVAHTHGNIHQIVYYQRGVGTSDTITSKLVGGLTGNEIDEHIREAYSFLANNFNPETQAEVQNQSLPMDQIVLLGFSRGAFTARAIASLISDIGLLTRSGMENFWGIFSDWMNQDVDADKGKWFKSKFGADADGKTIAFSDKRYRERLIKEGLTRYDDFLTISAVGVWDTVGSLGVPLPWDNGDVKKYSFVNTKVAQKVEHAFHAVALDEHRNLFTPTMWEQPDAPHVLRKLKQTWFPGVHSNIGGSYSDAGISLITLAWMMSQLEDNNLMAFTPGYLDFLQDENNKRYGLLPEPIRAWSHGRLYDSAPLNTFNGVTQGLKPTVRTPGRYTRTSITDGLPTKQHLKNTGESIHRCVRVRMNTGGKDTEDNSDTSKVLKAVDWIKGVAGHVPTPTYVAEALVNYDLVQPEGVKRAVDFSSKHEPEVVWKAKDRGDSLFEDEMGNAEIRLYKRSVEIVKKTTKA